MSRKPILPRPSTTVTVFETERVRIVRESGDGAPDFLLYLDGSFVKPYRSESAALVAANVWLEEQAAELALDVADEAAARALADEERYVAEVHALCAALQPQRERPIEAAPDMERRAHVVGGAAPVLRYDWAKFSVGQAGVRAYAVAGRAGRK